MANCNYYAQAVELPSNLLANCPLFNPLFLSGLALIDIRYLAYC